VGLVIHVSISGLTLDYAECLERVARRSGTQEWQQESLLLADNAKKRARAVVGVCVFSAVRSVFGYHATY